MTEVVDFKGKALPGSASQQAVAALRELLADIESGAMVMDKWMLLYVCPTGPDTTATDSRDSGITVEQAIYLLEASKFDILTKMRV